MVEVNKEFEIVLLNDKKKITIVSYGSMYPNNNELYLHDLQMNFLSVASDNLYYEYRGPIFLASEILKFNKELDLLLQQKIVETALTADEEEIEIKVKRKGGRYIVNFIFSKNDLKDEKWKHEMSFEMDRKDIEKICRIRKQ